MVSYQSSACGILLSRRKPHLSVEERLCSHGAVVFRGGDYDRWDLEMRGGLFGSARTLMTVEEHGSGKQFVRFRVWPRCSAMALVLFVSFALLALGAGLGRARPAAAVLGAVTMLLTLRTLFECGSAMSGLLRAPSGVPAEEWHRKLAHLMSNDEAT